MKPEDWVIIHHNGVQERTDVLYINGGKLFRTYVRGEEIAMTFVPDERKPGEASTRD